MTPAQLRAFSAVVRLGSVHAAAAELGMSDAGISMHVAQLRKELDDPLFARTAAGLAFTPGGLRLASRAIEILGLQQQTAIEVTEAAHGRRLLRIAASSAFAEHAAPGLIELFSSRANDLSVELSVHPTSRFRELISSRAVDIALGPERGRRHVRRFDRRAALPEVSDPHRRRARQPARHPSADRRAVARAAVDARARPLAAQTVKSQRYYGIWRFPSRKQRIFQSDAAALEEVQRVGGVTLAHRVRRRQRTSRPDG